MKKYILTIIITSMLLMACEENVSPEIESENSQTAVLGKSSGYAGSGPYSGNTGNCVNGVYEYSFTLWAGQHNDAGSVTIASDDNNLYVTYNTNSSADLSEVHVNVYADMNDLPLRRPAPGQAPYKAENLNLDSYTITIPLSDIGAAPDCGSVFWVAAHAALTTDDQSDSSSDEPSGLDLAGETAYAGGNEPYSGKGGGAWFYIAEYVVECCNDEAECPEYTWTLWAGQHNNAGVVTVSNDENNLYVTVNTNSSADLAELQLRIDHTVPDRRGAVGRYNMNEFIDLSGFPVDSYTITVPLAEAGINCEDQLYISVHAALTDDDSSDNGTDEAVPSDNGNYSPSGQYNSVNSGETAYGGSSQPGDSNFDSSGNTAYGGGNFIPPGGGSWFYYMSYSICCN